jgi:hypothetical protein
MISTHNIDLVNSQLQDVKALDLREHSSSCKLCSYSKDVQLQTPPTTWHCLQMTVACSSMK